MDANGAQPFCSQNYFHCTRDASETDTDKGAPIR